MSGKVESASFITNGIWEFSVKSKQIDKNRHKNKKQKPHTKNKTKTKTIDTTNRTPGSM